jgi:hypothetical protein
MQLYSPTLSSPLSFAGKGQAAKSMTSQPFFSGRDSVKFSSLKKFEEAYSQLQRDTLSTITDIICTLKTHTLYIGNTKLNAIDLLQALLDISAKNSPNNNLQALANRIPPLKSDQGFSDDYKRLIQPLLDAKALVLFDDNNNPLSEMNEKAHRAAILGRGESILAEYNRPRMGNGAC